MKKNHIHTIILQEEEIQRLTIRNKQLESGYRELIRINDRLRKQVKRQQRIENELNAVNI